MKVPQEEGAQLPLTKRAGALCRSRGALNGIAGHDLLQVSNGSTYARMVELEDTRDLRFLMGIGCPLRAIEQLRRNP